MIFTLADPASVLPVTALIATVPAGFPSPAADYIEGRLDLNEHLIHHPAATFIVRVTGDSMIGAGIFEGCLAIVDRSLDPAPGDIVVAALNGDLTVKFLRWHDGTAARLEAASWDDLPVVRC